MIVIGLLGAIALIVIAAINPIEQANRARDTRYKADGGQLISAVDRYFAAKSEFPWMTVDPNVDTDDPLTFISASDESIGICGATCSVDGVLISNDELKTEFRSRDFVSTQVTSNQIFIGKDQGASSSVYSCYIPLSKSVRETACSNSKVYTLSGGTRTVVANQADCAADSPTWTTQYVCVPE